MKEKNSLTVSYLSSCDNIECALAMKQAVRRGIKATLDFEKFSGSAEVSVTFASPEHIKRLNREHRNKNSVTDVLSFPMYERWEYESLPKGAPVMLGDIVICLDRAKSQAEEIGNTLIDEITFLAVHSTLHLLGYDHERSPEDDEAQCARQREITEKIKREAKAFG